jgi:hypothetical protein
LGNDITLEHLDHLSYVQGVEEEHLSLGTATNTITTATTTATMCDKSKTSVPHQGEDELIGPQTGMQMC